MTDSQLDKDDGPNLPCEVIVYQSDMRRTCRDTIIAERSISGIKVLDLDLVTS